MNLFNALGYYICVLFYEYHDPYMNQSLRTDDYINGSYDGKGGGMRKGIYEVKAIVESPTFHE